MAKAILVMDMPEDCCCCNLGEVIEWGMMMCSWEHRSMPMKGGRPDWCPFKKVNGDRLKEFLKQEENNG